MAKLTKYEKETIILFNEGEDEASIYTYNAGLRKRLANFSKKHPDLCRLEKSGYFLLKFASRFRNPAL